MATKTRNSKPVIHIHIYSCPRRDAKMTTRPSLINDRLKSTKHTATTREKGLVLWVRVTRTSILRLVHTRLRACSSTLLPFLPRHVTRLLPPPLRGIRTTKFNNLSSAQFFPECAVYYELCLSKLPLVRLVSFSFSIPLTIRYYTLSLYPRHHLARNRASVNPRFAYKSVVSRLKQLRER